MIGPAPVCETCERLNREKKGYTCEAFPDGVPDEVLFNGNPHTSEIPGDKGLLYKKREDG